MKKMAKHKEKNGRTLLPSHVRNRNKEFNMITPISRKRKEGRECLRESRDAQEENALETKLA